MNESQEPTSPIRVVGRNQEGTTLFLVDRAGNRFGLPIDTTLRSALNTNNPISQTSQPNEREVTKPAVHLRLATLTEVPTPREIQTLIRSGASIAEIALQSGLPEAKIERYADPILRERFHVAQQALGTLIKRSTQEGSELGIVVAARLSARGVSKTEMEWDSWRRDDAKWTIVLTFPSASGVQHAHWVLDQVRRTLTAEDDSARWLTGDERPAAEKVASRMEERTFVVDNPVQPIREIARLSTITELEPVTPKSTVPKSTVPKSTVPKSTVPPVATKESAPENSNVSIIGALPERVRILDPSAAGLLEEDDIEEELDLDTPKPSRFASREAKRGRSQVPGWDEIMFGAKKDSDPFE